MHILAIAGSLRKHSYNKGLLRVAQKVAPAGMEVEMYDLAPIPLFNEDIEKELPPSVAAFKEKIRKADAILFAVPEYNYSISGVLKNAIDWASRPYGTNAWDKKKVAIMGASLGLQGTSRAQYHLRQICVTLNMYPLNKPELMIPIASDKFDGEGNLIDEKTGEKIKELLLALRNS